MPKKKPKLYVSVHKLRCPFATKAPRGKQVCHHTLGGTGTSKDITKEYPIQQSRLPRQNGSYSQRHNYKIDPIACPRHEQLKNSNIVAGVSTCSSKPLVFQCSE